MAVATPPRPRLRVQAKQLLPLLALLGLLLTWPLVSSKQAEIDATREEVERLESQLPALRAKAAQVTALAAEVADLENRLSALGGPRDLASAAAQLGETLRQRGWDVRSVTSGETTRSEGLERTSYQVEFTATFPSLVEGLRSLRELRGSTKSLTLRLGNDGRLTGTAVIELLQLEGAVAPKEGR